MPTCWYLSGKYYILYKYNKIFQSRAFLRTPWMWLLKNCDHDTWLLCRCKRVLCVGSHCRWLQTVGEQRWCRTPSPSLAKWPECISLVNLSSLSITQRSLIGRPTCSSKQASHLRPGGLLNVARWRAITSQSQRGSIFNKRTYSNQLKLTDIFYSTE